MPEISFCPSCHQPIDQVAYFCPNCGKKIRSPPLSTSVTAQTFLYLKTLLLPPFGIIWGYHYLRQPDRTSKIIGYIVIIITIIETIWLTKITIDTVNSTTSLINSQIQQYGLQ